MAVCCGACETVLDVEQVPDWCPRCRSLFRRGAPHLVVWLGIGGRGGPGAVSFSPEWEYEPRGRWTDTHLARIRAWVEGELEAGE